MRGRIELRPGRVRPFTLGVRGRSFAMTQSPRYSPSSAIKVSGTGCSSTSAYMACNSRPM